MMRKAIEIVEELDYDFTKADKDTAMASGVIARTIVLDQMVGEFLEKNPDAVVVNIACGLDTRCYRMAGRYKRWYNVDLSETMQVRSGSSGRTDRSIRSRVLRWMRLTLTR